jgi:hypothetical protein
MVTSLRNLVAHSATAITLVFCIFGLSACENRATDPAWFVCDGVPITPGYLVDARDQMWKFKEPSGESFFVNVTRFQYCRRIKESEMHPAIFSRMPVREGL